MAVKAKVSKEPRKAQITMMEALGLLSSSHKRCSEVLQDARFLGIRKGNEIPPDFNSWKDFEKLAKSGMMKIEALLKARQVLTKLIVKSNMETTVSVEGVEMPLAQADAFQEATMSTHTQILEYFRQVLKVNLNTLGEKNKPVDEQTTKHIAEIMACDMPAKDKQKQIKDFEALYRLPYQHSLVDPTNIRGVIEKMDRIRVQTVNKYSSVIQQSHQVVKIELDQKVLDVLRET